MYGHPALIDQHARAFSSADLFGFEDVRDVAVLFARSDSVYKRLPSADVFDLARRAGRFQSGFRCNTRTLSNGLDMGDRK